MLDLRKPLTQAGGSEVSLRILVHQDTEKTVAKLARKTGLDSDVRTLSGDLPTALVDAVSLHSGIVVIQLSADSSDDVAAVQDFAERYPHSPVIAIGEGLAMSQVRRLMRAGVVDVLLLPLNESEFLEAVAEGSNRVASAPAGAAQRGRVIALMKASGGVGSTTLAVQTAHALVGRGRSKRKVCLIDFDLQFGNVGLYLDIEGERNLADFLRPPEDIDPTLFNAITVHHSSGIDVVVGPQTLWPVDAMDARQAQKVVSVATQMYDYVIIDLPDYWSDWTKAVLEKCDALVLVMQMTVAAVRHARRRFDLIQAEELGDMPIFVVANRYNKPRMFASEKLKREEVERALGHKIDFVVPSLFKVINEAQNHGIPIAEAEGGRKLAKQIGEIAEKIAERIG